MFFKKPVEFEDVKELKKKTKLKLTDVVTGNAKLYKMLSEHVGVILLLAGFVLFYIFNHYAVENKVKRKVQLQEKVNNLKDETTATHAQLIWLTSQTSVAREVERRGLNLKEAQMPPVRIAAGGENAKP
ncbi:MAG: hypothetical protein LBO71_00240 [Prevotellaceae bacterium]|jgi:hypothetical protein|nr:hypothetical protein [Prevotellaceae bacterium]